MADLLKDPGLPRHDVGFGSVPEHAPNLADSFSSSSNPGYNSKIFWVVNCLILFLLFLTVIWCFFVQNYSLNETDRRLASDQYYRARLRRRRAREEESNEAPVKRQQQLHTSFARNRVQMTVEESDLIKSNNGGEGAGDSSIKEKKSPKNVEGNTVLERNDSNRHAIDIETGGNDVSFSSLEEESGQLKLRNGNLVPNCCAICLCSYEVGDVVTWSSNPRCVHAFHRECVTDWLIKMQPETPCPCCRQEFTDLEEIRKERKIKWLPGFALDFRAIRFW